MVAGEVLLRAARINARLVMLLDPGKLKSPDMGFRKGSMDKDSITVVKRWIYRIVQFFFERFVLFLESDLSCQNL